MTWDKSKTSDQVFLERISNLCLIYQQNAAISEMKTSHFDMGIVHQILHVPPQLGLMAALGNEKGCAQVPKG
jgi:hypothetical protein